MGSLVDFNGFTTDTIHVANNLSNLSIFSKRGILLSISTKKNNQIK